SEKRVLRSETMDSCCARRDRTTGASDRGSSTGEPPTTRRDCTRLSERSPAWTDWRCETPRRTAHSSASLSSLGLKDSKEFARRRVRDRQCGNSPLRRGRCRSHAAAIRGASDSGWDTPLVPPLRPPAKAACRANSSRDIRQHRIAAKARGARSRTLCAHTPNDPRDVSGSTWGTRTVSAGSSRTDPAHPARSRRGGGAHRRNGTRRTPESLQPGTAGKKYGESTRSFARDP